MERKHLELTYDSPTDEISVKKYILLLLEYFFLLLKNWYILLAFSALMGGYKYYETGKIKKTFPARVKLYIKPQDIAKESKSRVKIFSQLLSSRILLEKTFLSPVEVGDSTNLLINYYLDTYFKLKPEELDEEIPTGFRISSSDVTKLEQQEKHVLNKVMNKVSTPLADFSDGFISISADLDLGFITINASTPDEALSLTILETLTVHSKNLIIESSGFADDKGYKGLREEADSLSKKYQDSYYKLNKLKNKRERELKKETPSVREIKYLEKKIHRYEAKTDVFKMEYLSTIKQLKVAKLNKDNSTLLIRELERTYAPITPYKPSPMVAGIKFATLGGVIAVILVVFIRIFKNIKKELHST